MFSTRLRQARTKRNLTQAQLAEELGVSPGTITMWETGKREPNYSKLSQLAHFFGCTTDYLLGEPDVKQEANSTKQEWRVDEELKEYAMMYLRLDAEGIKKATVVIQKEFLRCSESNGLKPIDEISLTLFCK